MLVPFLGTVFLRVDSTGRVTISDRCVRVVITECMYLIVDV